MIDPALHQAYLETEYRVAGPPELVLRVGRAHPGLAALYRARGVDCAAFLTACNPRSRRLSDAQNAARQARLGAALAAAGHSALPGAGMHPTGSWPAEASFLVPGLTEAAARALGQRYAQDAIVWCGADAVPRLIVLR